MADTVNGAATAEPHGKVKQITLPSGATAEVRKGRGKDLMRAHRAVRGKDDPMAISFALIAELTNIDGKTIVYEDVLDEPLGCADAADGDYGIGFSTPSAAVFAGLVQFGFSVEELSGMEFEEIAYWMAAVMEHSEAMRTAAEKAAERSDGR